MNTKLGAITIAGMMLLDGGKETLAKNETIDLGNSKVGAATEQTRGNVDDCLYKGIKIDSKYCNEQLKYREPINNSSEGKITQNFENGKQKHEKDLIVFWGSVVAILGGICLLLGKDIISDKIQRKKIKKLQEELKVKIEALRQIYPGWFINIKKDTIDQIQIDGQVCYESLLDEGMAPKRQKKETIQKLQELKKKIYVLNFEFINLDSVYKDSIEELEGLYDMTLYLINKLSELGIDTGYSAENIKPTYKYNNIIKEIYDLQKIFNELSNNINYTDSLINE